MTDRQTNGQTELPLIDSTPERGRVKMIDEKGVHKRWDFHQLVSKGARFQNCQPLYYSYKTHKACAKTNKISF